MNITVGTIQRTTSQLTFNVAQADNNRNMSLQFVFNGAFASWGLGDNAGMNASLSALLPPSSGAPIGNVTLLELSGVTIVGTYGGSVTAVPEPSSALALIGLGVGVGVRYRRKLIPKKNV
jgi:hypothetical protein